MKRKKNIFKDVPAPRVPSNSFDLSHEVKMSAKFGYNYPIGCFEVMPGDVVSDQLTVFARFAPLLSPVMHRCDVKVDCFYVPNRIISDPWEELISGGQDGITEVVLPYVVPGTLYAQDTDMMSVGTLWDYMGLPVYDESGPNSTAEQISVLPFRVHAKIHNDYFRDPNLDDEIDIDTELEGDVSIVSVGKGLFNLQQRGWDREYFTAALPFAQRGATVLLPLAGTAEVSYYDTSIVLKSTGAVPDTGDIKTTGGAFATDVNSNFLRFENIDEIILNGGSTTINDFRRAIALQRLLENSARGGGRYKETLIAHWGVDPGDYRVQRAEFIGGYRAPVTISEVLATAESETVPVGDLAGHGISAGKSRPWKYFCREHGFVMCILSVVPQPAYASQGIHRMWSRKSRFDFPFPELANLGEQEILSKELFFSFDEDDSTANNTLFGYVPRYAEYKWLPDRIAGDFRTNLLFWHMARSFTSRPSLNSAFLKMQENNGALEESYRRIFAVQDGTDYIWLQLFHRLWMKRPLPYFGVPSING